MQMNKRILVISASPRKGGNSDTLCDQFILGAEEAGNRVEKIVLREKKMNFCQGCLFCQDNDGRCIQNDDMSEILRENDPGRCDHDGNASLFLYDGRADENIDRQDLFQIH